MEIEALQFFLAPFCMCLILVGIHCYLGLHVLKRGVIFLDLSLAQVAGLGTTLALLFQIEYHSNASYFISLAHTFLAAAIFTLARRVDNKIPQEVLVGIIYALASALMILMVHNFSHGAEHIRAILVGQILWVSWEDVIKTGLIYTFVAGVHYFFRKQMIAVSDGESKKNRAFWDFLFFALFGIVITSSVRSAGVLLVFSFLIVPALLATIFKKTIKGQLILGWVLGFFISVFALMFSYILDLPSGATLVVCFTVTPILLLPFLGKGRLLSS